MNIISSKTLSAEIKNTLTSNGIDYRGKSRLGIMPTPDDTIVLLKALGAASLIPSISAVIIQWLKNKNSRCITIVTMSQEKIRIEGLPSKEIIALLSKTESLIFSEKQNK